MSGLSLGFDVGQGFFDRATQPMHVGRERDVSTFRPGQFQYVVDDREQVPAVPLQPLYVDGIAITRGELALEQRNGSDDGIQGGSKFVTDVGDDSAEPFRLFRSGVNLGRNLLVALKGGFDGATCRKIASDLRKTDELSGRIA